ncbi:uncharacterized protein LOC123475368 [Daphnia magna]|uniref:uncharacterized protein LOC123475368 n=1 Tax=Daphnia magna TaxID=35525 RepID=UPI001E1BAFE0|nr:uncharacterized protein LOC123475368 [Daphnia magna]
MNLPSIRDDDSEALAKLNRTLHGAMHALRTGGYKQDLEPGMTLDHVVSRLPPPMRSSWGVKVYRMTPTRATLKDLAKWIDEIVMGELMTRSSTHRSPAPQKEKKAGGAKPSTKPTPLFDKGPVVFHTSTYLPVKKPQPSNPSENHSSLPLPKRSVLKKCLYCDNAHSIKTCSTFRDLDVTARVEWVKEKRLCFTCLIGTHRGTECPTEVVCNIGNCNQRHHPLLHGAPRVYPVNTSATRNTVQSSSKSSDSRAMTIKKRDTVINTSLAIVPVLLQANGVEIETFVCLDPGATVNLIREDVAKQLICKGNAKNVSFGSFHGQDPQFQSTTVSLTVKARDRTFEADLKQVSTVPIQYLKLPCPPKELMEIRGRYPHLKDVKLVDVGEPTILIGAGNQWLHLRLDKKLPPVGTDTPFCLLTPFCWTCLGYLTVGTQQHASAVCRSNKPLLAVQKLCYSVQELPTEALLLRQVEKLRETESFPTVTPAKPLESDEDKLARKKLEATIQFNGPNALCRLFPIENKFANNSNFAERYKAVIDDYVAKGFARPLKESELRGTFGRNWYLPHNGIVNHRKPEKVTVVFDASAKYQGVALNEILLKGPNLINYIGVTLLLFRERPVSLSGDIQQMFLQVGLKKEDRSTLRFLWRSPGSRKKPTVYERQRPIFGSILSPFICSKVLRQIADLHREEFPEAAEKVYKNFYVDYLLDIFYTEDEASRVVKDSTALLKKNDLPTERTLGVLYDNESDSFVFDVKTDVEARTKRRILSRVSTLYDPLDFLSPVILSAKRILQELWLVGVDWDDPIPEVFQHQWNKWTTSLNHFKAFKIPRALTSSSDMKDIQLHAFCDASTVGFGSVVYLRVTYRKNILAVNFVTSRVAPLCPLTVLKLELQGAIVALRLVKFVQSTLRIAINQIVYLSDSQTVLQWIASKTCRAANECSTGLLPGEMMENFRWVHGPACLQQEENAWPITIKLPETSVEDQEVSATNWVGLVYGPAPENRLHSLLERNSNYDLVMRVVSWILHFISNSKLKLPDRDKSRIGVKCLQRAADHSIKSAPFEIYSDGEGILRVGGRLNYALLSFDVNHPKFLPHDHPITRLIVMREHDLLFHPTPERLLISIRSEYWIIKGRVAIKKYLHKCFICKRHRATPCISLMAPLPRHRLIPFQRPFTHVGLDYFGPCNITIYRRKVKRYVLLITCLNTRAVHLEVAASLDLSSFLVAFASFSAQRGHPLVVYSDNGTQIVARDKAIQQGIERLNEKNIVGQIMKQKNQMAFLTTISATLRRSLGKSCEIGKGGSGSHRGIASAH